MLQIYKASAGSGKTYTLTREYIKYLIAAKDDNGRYRLRRKPASEHSRILAITFTNKATNEMTRRIIKELALLAGMSTAEELNELGLKAEEADKTTLMSDYTGDFMDPVNGLGCTLEELREAARTALTNLLYDYSYFNVSTIDSFFQSVLRMFTREVELPDNYSVELDNEFAIALGVNEMFNSLNYHTIPDTPEDVEQRWVKDWLYQFMQSKMADGSTFNMFARGSHMHGELVQEMKEVFNEEFKRRLDILRPYFADHARLMRFTSGLASITRELRKEIAGIAGDLLQSMPADAYYHHWRNAMVKMSAGETLASLKTVEKIAADGESSFTKAAVKKYGPNPGIAGRCCDLANDYLRYDSIVAEFKPMASRAYIFGLLSTIMTHIDTYCRDNQLVLLSETNSILKGLINDDETPFLYEKLGYYLDHFLIDEFQDTSPMQWENLKPLVMESLGRGKDDLVIGDEKQCIYRFRNSDPRLLGETVEKDATRRYRTPGTVDIKGIDLSDNSNWRSAEEIVRFNNTVFKTLAMLVDEKNGQRPGVLSATETYKNIIQQIDPRRKEKHGYVKIYLENEAPSRKNSATNDPDGQTTVTDTDTNRPDVDPALEFMTAEIRRQLDSGYRPGDIAVLVRDHRKGQSVITHLLRKMNDAEDPLPHFDIISEEAMGLSSSASIRLVISILRLVSLPEFLEADAKAVARSQGEQPPAMKQSDAYRRARLVNRFQFYMHLTHDDGTPYTASEALDAALVDNRTPAEDSDRNDDTMKSLLDMECLNLPAVVERIIHTFVPEPLKESDNLFLTTFQDLVYDYSQRGCHDIKSFLDWWDSNGSRSTLTSPNDNDSLTVMTIHKSKGLEFPCVHIPYANGAMFKERSCHWVDLDPTLLEALGTDPADVPPAMPLNVTGKMTASTIYGDSCLNAIAQSYVDELNVNYVAMTRPTTELIVYSPYKAGDTFWKLLRQALEKTDTAYLDSLGMPDAAKPWTIELNSRFDGNTFTLGEPTTAKPANKEEKETGDGIIELTRYATSDFIERARACTQLDITGPFDINDPRHAGTFMHAVMSRVTTRESLELAMRRQGYRFHLDKNTYDRIYRRLRHVVEDPDASGWFDGFERVITERTVTSRGDTRRPDRLVWHRDGSVDVIDYKFVEHLPETLDGNPTHMKYVAQVEQYRMDVRGNTHAETRGYIWYITDNDSLIVQI